MSSLAAETRAAVDAHPFVRAAIRAGIVNFSATARFLDVDGGTEAIATALRRYADELSDLEPRDGAVRVTMQSGVGNGDGTLLSVGGTSFAADSGSLTAILATGDVDGRLLGTIATRLADASVDVAGMGLTEGSVAVVVERSDATTALSVVEDAANGYR